MKSRFLFICSMLVIFTLHLYAQNSLLLKGDFMYTDVTVSHNGNSQSVPALIAVSYTHLTLPTTPYV